MCTPDLTPSPPSFSSLSSSSYSSASPAAVGDARPFQPVEPCDCGTTYCRCGLQIPQCLVEVTPVCGVACAVCVCCVLCVVCVWYVMSCAHSRFWVSCRIMRRCAPVRSGTRSSAHCNAAARSVRAPKPPPTSSSAPSTSSPYVLSSPSPSHGTQHGWHTTDDTTHDKAHGPDQLFFVRSAEVRQTTVAPSSLARTRVGVARRCWFAICRSTGARYLPFIPAKGSTGMTLTHDTHRTRTHDPHDTAGAPKP
jgi:hypothetical protein